MYKIIYGTAEDVEFKLNEIRRTQNVKVLKFETISDTNNYIRYNAFVIIGGAEHD